MYEWLEDLIEEEKAFCGRLRAAGAAQQAEARSHLLKTLEGALATAKADTVSVAVAAELTGVHEETVRRAIRSGELTDLREGGAGAIRVLVSELDILRGKARGLDKDDSEDYRLVDISTHLRRKRSG